MRALHHGTSCSIQGIGNWKFHHLRRHGANQFGVMVKQQNLAKKNKHKVVAKTRDGGFFGCWWFVLVWIGACFVGCCLDYFFKLDVELVRISWEFWRHLVWCCQVLTGGLELVKLEPHQTQVTEFWSLASFKKWTKISLVGDSSNINQHLRRVLGYMCF